MNALLGLAALGTLAQTPGPTVAGVCAIEPEGIVCWDERGVHLRELEAEVGRRLEKWPGLLSFVLGRKNRYLVVRPGEFESASYTRSEAKEEFFILGQGKDAFALLRLAPPGRTLTGTARISLSYPQGEWTDLPWRKGAKVKVDTASVEIGETENWRSPYGVSYGTHFMPVASWRFTLGIVQREDGATFSFFAVGKDGRPINYVDGKGRPLPDEVGEAALKKRFEPGYDWSKGIGAESARVGYTQQPFLYANHSNPGLAMIESNVDPKFVAKLRIQRLVPRPFVLGPYPLDPADPR